MSIFEYVAALIMFPLHVAVRIIETIIVRIIQMFERIFVSIYDHPFFFIAFFIAASAVVVIIALKSDKTVKQG